MTMKFPEEGVKKVVKSFSDRLGQSYKFSVIGLEMSVAVTAIEEMVQGKYMRRTEKDCKTLGLSTLKGVAKSELNRVIIE